MRDVAFQLREQGRVDLSEEVTRCYDAMQTLLNLTKYGDCLFGDEIRNVMNIHHQLRPRRGTDLDPMKNLRGLRRIRS